MKLQFRHFISELVLKLCSTDTGIVRLEKLFTAHDVQVAAASFVMIEAILCSDNRPLFVLTSGSKSIKPSIVKVI
jgi:hypothetical protein